MFVNTNVIVVFGWKAPVCCTIAKFAFENRESKEKVRAELAKPAEPT